MLSPAKTVVVALEPPRRFSSAGHRNSALRRLSKLSTFGELSDYASSDAFVEALRGMCQRDRRTVLDAFGRARTRCETRAAKLVKLDILPPAPRTSLKRTDWSDPAVVKGFRDAVSATGSVEAAGRMFGISRKGAALAWRRLAAAQATQQPMALAA